MCAVGGTEGIKPVLINRAASVPTQEKHCHHISVLGEGSFRLQPPLPYGMCLSFDACFDALVSSSAAMFSMCLGGDELQ